MTNEIITKRNFDLEERTSKFAKNCIDICKGLVKDTINKELISQLIRAAGSVGANYREANDSLSRKDFYHRIGICRKEAKESRYWLGLLLHANVQHPIDLNEQMDEALQLTRIFASIIKTKDK